MSKIISARFAGAIDGRRDKRINDVLDRFYAWKLRPSGHYLGIDPEHPEEDREFMHTAVEWIEENGTTTITINEVADDVAERLTSELRACGMVVTAQAEHEEEQTT